ncbi:hypothetical protein A2160_05295 [Candidatus Beckwithbacteria bacterium RBG_13_42_9]|uniref:DUF5678 domain-containing protein n=1 Tax=Candidatus Beckwithbacteria bacterium RBG_13_42_9 TaxID=1797457 RepID=A0A1F5E6S0_9BACT|nr:MAG: hypothetical protein A2160_05295 [Candidatus Beckwithbacteria bacterium RBG_13_42_9]
MVDTTQNQNIPMNTPRDTKPYRGEFIVFFSDETNPDVLFHSPIADEAYKKAYEVKTEQGKQPTVIRIPEDANATAAMLFSMHT